MMGWKKQKNPMVSSEDLKLPAGKYELVNSNNIHGNSIPSSPVKKSMNKYVIACAVLASMNSILLGYGMHCLSFYHNSQSVALLQYFCFRSL